MPENRLTWPLLTLMERIGEWHDSANSDVFWDPEAEHFSWMDSLRAEAKELIVWLELKQQSEAAAQLDSAVQEWREAALDYRDRAEVVYPSEDFQCRDLRDVLVEAASKLMGVCEDLDGEVPAEVWEGFHDE